MNIYFCLSYLSVPHTITLIRNYNTSNFRIVTSNKQLYEFFNKLFDKEKLILIPSFSYTIHFSKKIILFPMKIIWILIMKQKTWRIFKGYNQQKVYFFFNASAYSQAWLIYKLSKKNLLFYQEDIDLSTFTIKNGIESWIAKIFIKLVYNVEVYPIDQGNGLVSYKIKNIFLKKIKAQTLNIQLNYKEISNWVNKLMELPNGDILMLSNSMLKYFFSVENHVNASDQLIEQLKLHNYNVHFKMHSRALTKYSLEKTLYEIPQYLPASLLLNYKVFIGYGSSALIEAANNDILTISLVDYTILDNNIPNFNVKTHLRKGLKKNKEIFFPKSLNEILEIINNQVN